MTQTAENQVENMRKNIVANARRYRALLEADEKQVTRFMAEAHQVVMHNPKLLTCNPTSVLMAIGEAAAMGLSLNPNHGESYLIPRRVDNVLKAHFQVGYKGLLRLMHRSGKIDWIYADVAYVGEDFVRQGGTDPKIHHIPDDGVRTGRSEDFVCSYAAVALKGSTRPLFWVVSSSELVRVAQSSGDPRNNKPSDTWREHAVAMAIKTALIRVTKLMPRSDHLSDVHTVAHREEAREAGVEVQPLPGMEDIKALAPEPSTLGGMDAMADMDAVATAAEEGADA
jgi:recombination protein RecT